MKIFFKGAKKMDFVFTINFIIAAVFFLCYSYQFLYIPAALLKKEPPHKPEKKNRFAVLVSARNEEKVIGHLLQSIKDGNSQKILCSSNL